MREDKDELPTNIAAVKSTTDKNTPKSSIAAYLTPIRKSTIEFQVEEKKDEQQVDSDTVSTQISQETRSDQPESISEEEKPNLVISLTQEITTCLNTIKVMKSACAKQKNISIDIKNGLALLEESRDKMNWDIKSQKKSKERTLQTRATPSNILKSKGNTRVEKASPIQTVSENSVQRKRPPTSPLSKKLDKRTKKTAIEQSITPQQGKISKAPIGNTVEESYAEALKKSAPPRKAKKINEELLSTGSSDDRKVTYRKKRNRKPRLEAILLKPRGEEKYSDILREIRTKVNPGDTETIVRTVRKTKLGDVLLELGPKTKNKEAFRNSLQAILGEKAKVCQLESKTAVEIRDLDELTTLEEVEEAIRKKVNDPTLHLKVGITKQNANALRMAIVSLNARVANDLLKTGRIQIGWVQCRIRGRVEVPRCFKCFGYGHQQGTCTNVDRRGQGLCLKCGEKGHKKVECQNPTKCFLCEELKITTIALDHVPGSGKCQVFRESLEREKKKFLQ